MGDQHGNAFEAQHKGFGLAIPFQELTQEKLSTAIQDILKNPSYSNQARIQGSFMSDQPQHPLDKAVWWMEFLLRHKGKNYLKSPVHDLTWYQYFMLDVVAFLILALSIIFYIFYKILCCLFGLCRKKKQTKEKQN